MARRTNSINLPGVTKGGRPAGSAARLSGGAKVSIATSNGTDTFSGRVPGAMKGIVGGSGQVTTNSRPVTNKSGKKGFDRSQRG
jgi:hypothetical protein